MKGVLNMKFTTKILSTFLIILFFLASFVGCGILGDINISSEDSSFEESSSNFSGVFDSGDFSVNAEDTESADDSFLSFDDSCYESDASQESAHPSISEYGTYTSAEDVALYIHTYGKLPSNFITKNEARKLGWEGGGLEKYAPGKCIGGDRFGNYEGILPEKNGRYYTECDIDTLNQKTRGAKRIVFSNDGLIYYTEDHYETFELLYGEE